MGCVTWSADSGGGAGGGDVCNRDPSTAWAVTRELPRRHHRRGDESYVVHGRSHHYGVEGS